MKLPVLIVSKDRPLFLYTYLKSLKDVSFDIWVYWYGSTPEYVEAYYAVINRIKKTEKMEVMFVQQETQGRMLHFFQSWLQSDYDIFMVSVDDNVCAFENINTLIIADVMKDENVFGFSLRLHPGICKTQATEETVSLQQTTPPTIALKYNPKDYPCPWNYCWEMSSTFYRKEDLQKIVGMGQFATVNELEGRGMEYFVKHGNMGDKLMACFHYAPLTNIFVETAFRGSQQHLEERLTNQQALEMFEEGWEIDVKQIFQERDKEQTTHVKKIFLK